MWGEDWAHGVDPDTGEALGSEGQGKRGESGELSHDDLLKPLRILHPRKALTFAPDTKVSDVLAEMLAKSESCVLIVADDDVVGIFTERDVLLRLHGQDMVARTTEVEIREVMTADPEVLLSTDNLAYALNRMSIGGYRHIPILEPHTKENQGEPFEPAVLSVKYLITYLADFFPDIVYNIPPQPSRSGTNRFGA